MGGQVLFLLCSTTCGNGEDGGGIFLIMSISISSVWARWRRLCVHGVIFYPTEGSNSMKTWRVSCGTVVSYINQVQGFLKYMLRNRGWGSSSLPGLGVPVERDWLRGGVKIRRRPVLVWNKCSTYLWMVEVVLEIINCTGIHGEETREVIRTL